MMIRKHQLPRVFPDKVLAEARTVALLDDAEVIAAATSANFPLSPSTAKPQRILTMQSSSPNEPMAATNSRSTSPTSRSMSARHDLDLEARLRGTSVYFPDRAIPMLPQELSPDICSLRPSEDRLVLSCLMQLDAAGRIESYEIVEGVIRSAERMTYT